MSVPPFEIKAPPRSDDGASTMAWAGRGAPYAARPVIGNDFYELALTEGLAFDP